MRRRTLSLVANLSGFPMSLGTVSIQKYAKVRKADTILVCPECGEKPTWFGEYRCNCGKTYGHWSKLKRIVAATRQVVEKEKLTAGETVQAEVYVMDAKDYAEKYADATLEEHGLIAKDEQTTLNVRKLLIAVERLGKVVIIRFNDTYETRICLLSMSMSGRVVLREIIPVNLAEITETLKVEMGDVTEADIVEAQQLVKMLKPPTEDVFVVSDYRTIGLSETPPPSPKVQSFKEILAKVRSGGG